MKKKSVLKNLYYSFLVFGFSVGLVFPVYAQFFVEWKPGMFIWFTIGCVIAGSSIGLFNYLITKIVLVRNLRKIADAAANVASAKDLRQECELESHDVIGEIVESFNAMVDTMRNMIVRISQGSSELDGAATQLNSMSETTNSEVATQHEEIQQLSEAVRNLTNSIQEVAESALAASEVAKVADDKADMGRGVVSATGGSIKILADEINRAVAIIANLENESKAIGTVLDVITDIAEQTNLLALNAAIEAARAGEQGRGFAVVADEVRTLASRTQESTLEIQEIIKRLQNSTADVVDTMSGSEEHAKQSVDQSEITASTLDDIAESVSHISNMNETISNNASTQSALADEIHNNAQTIAEFTNKTAENTQQLTQSSEKMNQLSRQLNQMISEFKV
jgi:methyl-accepting chemotaxis protein